jgi:hypothetical protein
MCSDDNLRESYERGDILEGIRFLARYLRRLQRGGFLDTKSGRRVYVKLYQRLIRLRAVSELYKSEQLRRNPMSMLQRVYDQWKDFGFRPDVLDNIARRLLPSKVTCLRTGDGRKDNSADAVVALRRVASSEVS